MAEPRDVKCVKVVGCMGGTSHYENATIQADDEIFYTEPKPTSVLWELPLVIRKVKKSSVDNQHITWLMIDDESGFAPPYWQGNIGDAIVARQDKKDLSVAVYATARTRLPTCSIFD